MELDFKTWLNKVQETGTSTACIATFARPVMPIVRRDGTHEETKKKKKKK
jgi:hypothetical protein